jgi:outer membrane lipoprotein-sorting protein
MNDNEKYIEEFVNDIPFDAPDEKHRNELKNQLLNAFPKHRLQPTVHTVPLWRTIMKSRIPKLAAAAAITIIVLGGITFWTDSSPDNGKWWLGPSAAWGQEIMDSLEKIEALVYRQRSASVRDFGPIQMRRGWERRYNAKDRYRRDRYDDGKNIANIQWIIPDGEDFLMVEVSLEYKCYFERKNERYGFIPNPVEELGRYARFLDRADRILGTREFEGRECIGFELSAGKYGDNPDGRFDRIWFDLKTKLPMRIERHGIPYSFDAGDTMTIIHDQFEYYAKVPVDLFEPQIPEGFIFGHPDEIRAAREKERKQSGDSVQAVQDPDRDGLENRLEAELGTNPSSSDTDGDGLSDYDEYCKYRTDPTKKDSDGDGKPDGDWDERREYTYTIRAICEIRPPSRMEIINDLYQDARPFEKEATLKDARVVEVLIYPFAEAHVYPQPYPKENLDKKLKEYIQPTVSMNYSPETKEQIDNIVEGSATDVAAIEKMLQWLNHETRLVRELPHWEYFHIIDGKIVWHKSLGSPARNEQFLETNFLGDSMFKNKVHGTCSSTAIIRGTMFRAAGLPTRLIQTLPLMTRYSEDPEPLADRLRMREMAKGYTWGPGSGGANHTYNEVFLNNRWVRVDNSIGTGPFVGNKLFVKAWSSADWNNLKEEWNNKRCFRALDVSDAHPKYKSESTKVDIAIADKNLIVTKKPDGLFEATIIIYNKGFMPIPRFGVNFYAGDPDKGGRLLSRNAAGPIMPGSNWAEGIYPERLKPGENTISVVVDPGNKVEESDETNNKASQTISTTVKGGPAESTESIKVDIAIEDNDLKVTKLSDRLFEAVIALRNKGSVPLPRFSVYFYAGDPDKGGRLLSHPSQSAGPIMPGGSWLEGIHPQRLKPGEDTVSVVLDPDNRVEESDETNNKASQTLSKIVSESEKVDKVGAIQKVDLLGDDILQVEAQSVEGFNFPFYLFIPSGIDKNKPVYMLVEPNNSGMVSDDLEVHRVKALMLVKRSHASRMARRLGVPLLVPTFPRQRSNWLTYTHALDIDTLEIEAGKLKRVDLQLTAMIKHAQELLRINGFTINERVFMHGFSASAKFCNRYSYLHPEMVKAAAAGGVNGLPTLPVREWNGYELPFPIGTAGIEKFTGKPFSEKAFGQVAHFIYMGSSDRNDTLLSREAWREEEADIIRKALAAEKMMPDRWELSRKIYRQQKLHAQLVTYDGVGHSIKSEMLDDVIDFFKANAGEKFVRIKPYEYPFVEFKEIRPKYKTESTKIDIAIEDKNLTVTKQPDGSFRTEIAIYNKGSYPLPQFGVNFYAGDPDKGGRLLSTQAAGPIIPGAGWGEYNPGLRLRSGENTISVVVDPGNKVEESNETNNKVSRVIPGRQSTTTGIPGRQSKTSGISIDLVVEDNGLSIEENPNGSFHTVILIHNKGSAPSPQFRVNFYAGDPDEGGRLLSEHNSGPIMPGGTWGEGDHGLILKPGEDTITVAIDPDNKVEESNETNNKVSKVIPGKQ